MMTTSTDASKHSFCDEDTTKISHTFSNVISKPLDQKIGLKKVAPYWFPYRTMAKGRWFDREILEMISTEFRDRSVEYYVCLPFQVFLLAHIIK